MGRFSQPNNLRFPDGRRCWSLSVGGDTTGPPSRHAMPLPTLPPPPPLPDRTPVADLGTTHSLPADIESRLRPLPSPPPRLPSPWFKVAPAGADASTLLNFPLDLPPYEVSRFGWRWSDGRQAWRMHAGLDLSADEGDPVRPLRTGRVALVDWISGYGLTVVIDHGDGHESLYGHLSAVDVRPGETVTPQDLIGRVGQTGSASGPHLHVEWRRRDGGRVWAIDPAPLLPPTLAGLERRPAPAGTALLP